MLKDNGEHGTSSILNTELVSVEVRNGKGKSYYAKDKLEGLGLKYRRTGKYAGHWEGNVNKITIDELTSLCKKV
ncbi:hypothetical protein CWE04_05045 [Thomasclavelia cocleata]|uniref:Uncharacterized protein n=1 Tax=Thomasclavelia cocleata TaxID=69824 RepID=A0A1I0CP64_9FIRM|nr:hypothetical protein [Thomasclavelia cocleata]MCR1960763.1 hypothetical protein [Thomasclavelia cocleata]NDO42577.1 hypothetical protein [Thomasclavelia cocleata]PJN81135.1 hypothetical protein CWE04_05045 [Thomasclavelia cocleata]SET21058.1 hypothetical protein SAMN04489758_103138 [Thomasclavelia cocleata]